MAQSSWPDPSGGRSVNDLQYEQLVSSYTFDGLVPRPDGADLCYGDSSGMKANFRIGSQVLLRGHMWTSGPSVISVDIDDNPAGQTRYDLVVIRLNRDDSYQATAEVRKGTPGAGLPSYTRTEASDGVWEMPVAQVAVAPSASTIGGSDVTTVGWYINRGGDIQCTSSTRPPHRAGLHIFETDTKRAYVSNGTSWILDLEDTGWVTLPFAGSNWTADSTANPIIRRYNGVVYLRLGDPKKIGTLLANNDSHIVDIPEGFRTTYFHRTVAQCPGGAAAISIYHSNYTNVPARANQVWLTNAPQINNNTTIWIGDVAYPI
jgi:hypothetical protein